MASRTVAYFAVLLMWFIASAFIGYGSASQADQFLSEVSGGPGLHTTIENVASNSSDGMTSYHINWGGFDSWATNLAKGK